MTMSDSDALAIRETIDKYRLGWTGNIHSFIEAFDENARIYFIDANGNAHSYRLQDCFENWSNTYWEILCNIISIDKVNHIATVKLEFNNLTAPESSFIDIHSLVKMKGTWKIVNKIAIHKSLAS